MHAFIFRNLAQLRQNYWFWPSLLTAVAFVLGLVLPYIDQALGAGWMHAVPFLRPTGVDGARAILTTLAGATLGVAGVAFSITIVAVNFASSNYGPRLIGNFMGDRIEPDRPGRAGLHVRLLHHGPVDGPLPERVARR